MKKAQFLLILFSAIAVFFACQKENSSPGLGLTASKKQAIKIGEPVIFELHNTDSVYEANWTVSPDSAVEISDSGHIAVIVFGAPGTYTIHVTCNGLSSTQTVLVGNSMFFDDSTHIDTSKNGGHEPGFLFLTNDQLHLEPSAVLDSMGFSTLLLVAKTVNKYPCTNTNLLFGNYVDAGKYALNFTGLATPAVNDCIAGNGIVAADIYLSNVTDGSHEFTVTLNEKTYTGSFTKTDKSYEFVWPYIEGVTLSPLKIQ
jgi:hypothetical protein